MNKPAFLISVLVVSGTAAHGFTEEAKTPTASGKLDRVEVQGTVSDEDTRRGSTAAKIVIGRTEIERLGDSRAGELLVKLPSIVVVGGRISLKGLPGYTQVLVDGRPPPPNFDLFSLPSNQVERIEIVRSSIAEFGAQAVAGTINIVLRRGSAREEGTVSAEVESRDGRIAPALDWNRTGRAGPTGPKYSLALSATSGNGATTRESDTTLGGPASEGFESIERYRSAFSFLNGRSDWIWDEPAFGRITLTPSVGLSEIRTSRAIQEKGEQRGFDSSLSTGNNRTNSWGLGFGLMHPLSADSKIKFNLRAGTLRGSRRSDRDDQSETLDLTRHRWNATSSLATQDLSLAWQHETASEHSLSIGLQANRSHSRLDKTRLLNGLPDLLFSADSGPEVQRRMESALFFQDEWSLGALSFNAGLRWESISQDLSLNEYSARSRLALFAPSGHVQWRLDPKGIDSVRVSLSRTYRAPSGDELMQQPVANAQFPCTKFANCGSNSAAFPDSAGNIRLRPETSLGLDLSYEHSPSAQAYFSASLFAKQIDNYILSDTRLEPVGYASVPRWINRPYNFGRAWTQGVEIEAKLPWGATRLDVGLGWMGSRVSGLPAPGNRIADQPRLSAKFGIQYKLRDLPLSMGFNARWLGASAARVDSTGFKETGQSRHLSANLRWTPLPETQITLSARDLAPTHQPSMTAVNSSGQRISTQASLRGSTSWSLRAETRF